MRKQELVHLHALLGEVQRYCTQTDDLSVDLSEYKSMQTDSLSVHRNKHEHKEAAFALTEAITGALRDEQTAVAAPNAD